MNIKSLAILSLIASTATGALAAPADSIGAPQRKPLHIVTSGLAAAAINGGITEALKHSVHEWRPNLADDRAFPSRHTSWAFAASTFLSNNFYSPAPWLPLASQALASAVGLQRVHCGAHYGGDVAAGMALGAGSAVAAQALSDLVFGRRVVFDHAGAVLRPSVEVRSGVLLPFGRGEGWRSGYSSAVRGTLPVSSRWNVTAGAGAFAVSRVNEGHTRYTPAVEGLDLTVGTSYFIPLGGCLAVKAEAEAGAAYVRRWSSRWGVTASCGASLQWQLSRSFATSLNCACRYLSAPSLGMAAVSASSVYKF